MHISSGCSSILDHLRHYGPALKLALATLNRNYPLHGWCSGVDAYDQLEGYNSIVFKSINFSLFVDSLF